MLKTLPVYKELMSAVISSGASYSNFVGLSSRAFSSNLGKRPLAKIVKKMINLTSKLGEIKDIEHDKDSKIYPDMGHCFS